MSAVNYSIPDEVRTAFNEAFANESKSAVIARLMQEAVERRAREKASAAAFDRIIARREQRVKKWSDSDLRSARQAVRG